MDITTFKLELAKVLAQALTAQTSDFAIHEMTSFDLGMHPWHGYIEPSFRTTEDTTGFKAIGDWKLYNFADTSSERWAAVKQLANWMKIFYAINPEKHATELFVAAAEVLKSVAVAEALIGFRKTPDFFVSVYNPDDPSFTNFCASLQH